MGYNPKYSARARFSHGHQQTSATNSPTEASDARLDSWKEIAAYLKRDERTVRRWKQRAFLFAGKYTKTSVRLRLQGRN